MAESTAATRAIFQCFDFDKFRPNYRGDYELGDTFPRPDRDRLLPQIYK
jgi:hypothetical protein